VRRIGAIDYYNCGDWVEHCSALVEHGDGRIELVDFHAAQRAQPLLPGLFTGDGEAA
jgi:hypothetical protein